MKIATAASFLWLMKVVYCQVVINTTCPKLDVVHNFQLKRYLGLWYEIESYPAMFAKFSSCVTAQYTEKADGDIQVLNRSFNTSSQMLDSAIGNARLVGGQSGGRLIVSFPNSQYSRPIPSDGNYLILDTDYDKYSVVWSCESFRGKSFQFLWHLSRDQSPSEQDVISVRQKMDSLGLDRRFLLETKQKACPKD